MRMKASAYKQYGDAAILSLVLESLPQVGAWDNFGQLYKKLWDKSHEVLCGAAAVKCKILQTLPCQVLWEAIMDIETKHSSEAGALINDPAPCWGGRVAPPAG